MGRAFYIVYYQESVSDRAYNTIGGLREDSAASDCRALEGSDARHDVGPPVGMPVMPAPDSPSSDSESPDGCDGPGSAREGVLSVD